MFSNHSQAKLALIYPELSRRLVTLEEMCQAENPAINIEISQALRTQSEQKALWMKGRDAQGNIIDPHAVVTHAPPGHSYHEFALAIDFFVVVNGEAVWDVDHGHYMMVVEKAESLGLVSGARWPEPKTDVDHLQLTGNFDEAGPDANCRYIFNEGGFQAVFDEVNKALGIG